MIFIIDIVLFIIIVGIFTIGTLFGINALLKKFIPNFFYMIPYNELGSRYTQEQVTPEAINVTQLMQEPVTTTEDSDQKDTTIEITVID